MEENHTSNDGWCCYCCLGLALGYVLWHGTSHGATLPKDINGNINEKTSISQQVSPNVSIDDYVVSPEQNNFLLRQIDNYQQNIGPVIKEKLHKDKLCRYEPSCSEYAKQVIIKHGRVKGSLKAIYRLLRCNPFSKGGHDPV